MKATAIFLFLTFLLAQTAVAGNCRRREVKNAQKLLEAFNRSWQVFDSRTTLFEQNYSHESPSTWSFSQGLDFLDEIKVARDEALEDYEAVKSELERLEKNCRRSKLEKVREHLQSLNNNPDYLLDLGFINIHGIDNDFSLKCSGSNSSFYKCQRSFGDHALMSLSAPKLRTYLAKYDVNERTISKHTLLGLSIQLNNNLYFRILDIADHDNQVDPNKLTMPIGQLKGVPYFGPRTLMSPAQLAVAIGNVGVFRELLKKNVNLFNEIDDRGVKKNISDLFIDYLKFQFEFYGVESIKANEMHDLFNLLETFGPASLTYSKQEIRDVKNEVFQLLLSRDPSEDFSLKTIEQVHTWLRWNLIGHLNSAPLDQQVVKGQWEFTDYQTSNGCSFSVVGKEYFGDRRFPRGQRRVYKTFKFTPDTKVESISTTMDQTRMQILLTGIEYNSVERSRDFGQNPPMDLGHQPRQWSRDNIGTQYNLRLNSLNAAKKYLDIEAAFKRLAQLCGAR